MIVIMIGTNLAISCDYPESAVLVTWTRQIYENTEGGGNQKCLKATRPICVFGPGVLWCINPMLVLKTPLIVDSIDGAVLKHQTLNMSTKNWPLHWPVGL